MMYRNQERKSSCSEQKDVQTDLYISNIPSQWTDSDLTSYFAKFEPRRCHILVNQNTGFANFSKHQQAFAAITEYHNKRPFPSAMPLWIKFARKSRAKSGDRGMGINHNTFWIKSKNESTGRIKPERDLNKLQELMVTNPDNAAFHYEYSLGIACLLDSASKKINNPNLVPEWLKHINIAIDLSKKTHQNNKPTFAWIARKIDFCIHLYQCNENCHNIDIEDLLQFAWNAVVNYDEYYFYLSYLTLLYVSQREELLTESLKLFQKIWNGNQRRRYFHKYKHFVHFILCMIANGCQLTQIMDIMTECWGCYHSEYGFDITAFEKQKPVQKTATFNMYLMVIVFCKYLRNELEWKVDRKIIMQCIKWLEITIELRPYYGDHYIHLSYCYFFVFNDYVKARNILENAVKNNCDKYVYTEIIKNSNENKKNGARNEKKWAMFVKWVQQKVLNVEMDHNEKETPFVSGGGMIEPGSKFNIAMI